MTDGLTVEDLRWAEGLADERAYQYAAQIARSHTRAIRAVLEEKAAMWRTRADRFRAAAEAMEREGKRDGD